MRETAFNCPHCGALAKQFWHTLRADLKAEKSPIPEIVYSIDDDDWSVNNIKDAAVREQITDFTNKMASGLPFFELGSGGAYNFYHVHNVHVSHCFNCKDIALWIYDRLIYPQKGEAPPANPDLPEDIRRDYEEASTILDLSPRGAAALIRLCIQKLCKHLGQPGKNINDDIGALVAEGLNPRVQKALDAVRVIGNQAVHPGSMDLRDDRATAESLFRLLNLIVEKMISEPKHVDQVYASLPKSILLQIEKRDGDT